MGKFKSGHLVLNDADQIKLGDADDVIMSWDNASGNLGIGVDNTGIDIYDTTVVDGKMDFLIDNTISLTINNTHNLVVGDGSGSGRYTLPLAHNASAGQILTVDAAGAVTWAAPAGSTAPFQIIDGDSDTFIRTEAAAANDDDYFYGEIGATNAPSLLASATADSNTYFGFDCGASLVGSFRNTMFGYQAGSSLGGGDDNTLIGYQAGPLVGTTGFGNTIVGSQSGTTLSTGDYNIIVGNVAAQKITTGANNIILGYQAGGATADGGFNGSNGVLIGNQVAQEVGADANVIAIGNNAMRNSASGAGSIAIGYYAMSEGDSDNAVYIGYQAGQYASLTSVETIAIGYLALAGAAAQVPAADRGILIGAEAGRYMQTGVNAIAMGRYALGGTTVVRNTGSGAIALGYQASQYSTTGANNIAIGYQAHSGIVTQPITAQSNVAVGYTAGQFMNGGSDNTMLGSLAMQGASTMSTTATNTVAIGYAAGRFIGSGTGNIAIGNSAMYSQSADPSTGTQNVVIGDSAGYFMRSGDHNVLIGTTAGYSDGANEFDGDDNVCIGRQAGYNLTGDATNSCAYNVFLGYRAGFALDSVVINRARFNICIGYQSGDSLTTGASNIIIGHDIDASAVGVDDELRIGHTTPTISADLSTGAVTFANGAYTFPVADGSVGEVLKTDGGGNLSFGVAGGAFTSASNGNMDIGATIVDSFNPTADGSVVWFYHIEGPNTGAINMRSGQVIATWDDTAGTVTYTEASTVDIGDTSPVTLTVVMSAALGDVRLTATVTTNDWVMRVKRLEI